MTPADHKLLKVKDIHSGIPVTNGSVVSIMILQHDCWQILPCASCMSNEFSPAKMYPARVTPDSSK